MLENKSRGRLFRTGEQEVARREKPAFLRQEQYQPAEPRAAEPRATESRTAELRPPVAESTADSTKNGATDADTTNEKENDTGGLRKLLWLLAVIFGLLILGQVIIQLVITPSLVISTIIIESPLAWDKATVLNLTGLPAEPLYDSVDTAAIATRLEQIPVVKSARVEKVFPDTLHFNIQPRTPLVQSLLEDGTVVLIDDEGVVYDYVQTLTAHDLPVLSGLEFRNFSLGTRLPETMLPFLTDLMELRDKQVSLYQAFSEFRLETNGGQDLEILCLASQGGVPVRITSRLSAEAAGYILRVLQMLASTEGFAGVQELDFRSRDIIIKKKGES